MTALILPGATTPLSTVTSSQGFDTTTGVKQVVPHCHFPMMQGGKDLAFPTALADSFWAKGQLYCHTWGTWDLTTKVAWTSADVVAGRYNPYLHAQAALLRKWGRPVFIRLDHEMQGSWAPWYSPGPDFVALWQYIVQLFRDDGASNVTWVWCPNQIDPGKPAIDAWYPGDEYVDWIGFDAYNGSSARSSSWQSWAAVSDRSYSTLHLLAPSKPMFLGEFACHDQGGNKAQWITEAFAYIAVSQPAIRATSWFNKVDRGANWPLSVSDGSAAAYAAAIKTGPYAIPGTFPMPPDLQPIRPLYGASWATTDALLAQLATAQATIALRDLKITTLQNGVLDLAGQLATAAEQYAASLDALTAARAEVDQWRAAGSQVTSGLDNMRSILLP